MNVRKTDEFMADIARQYRWYILNASEDVANRYSDAIETTGILLGHQPQIGPVCVFRDVRLRDWRSFLVVRPFHKHVLFYEIIGSELILRRALHGHRDLPRRLLQKSGGD